MPNHKMNNVSSADVTHNRAEQSTNEQRRQIPQLLNYINATALRHLPESCYGFLLDDGLIAIPSLGLQRRVSFPLLTPKSSPDVS
jgi:hypothetical protein